MMTKFKRKLVAQDDNQLTIMLTDLHKYRPYLEAVKAKYEKLEISDFSNEIYLEIVIDGIAGVEDRLRQKLDKEIAETGINAKYISENIKAASIEPLQEFRNAVNALLEFDPNSHLITNPRISLPLHFITYTNGDFVVTQQSREKLLEKYFRTYVESIEEMILFEKLESVVKAWKELREEMKKYGVAYYNELAGVNRFISYEGGAPKVIPTSFKSIMADAKRERWGSKKTEPIPNIEDHPVTIYHEEE